MGRDFKFETENLEIACRAWLQVRQTGDRLHDCPAADGPPNFCQAKQAEQAEHRRTRGMSL